MVSKNPIIPSKKSLDIVREISTEVPTFHHHFHILYDIAQTHTGHVDFMEIGTFHGASACLMLQRPDTRVVTMDLGGYVGEEKVLDTLKKFNIHDNDFSYIQYDSHSLKTRFHVGDLFPTGVDILFIDADHSRDGILIDFLLYGDLVRQSGYLVFDDYNDFLCNPQVHVMIDELMECACGWNIIGTISNTLGAYAEPDNIPAGNCFIIHKK